MKLTRKFRRQSHSCNSDRSADVALGKKVGRGTSHDRVRASAQYCTAGDGLPAHCVVLSDDISAVCRKFATLAPSHISSHLPYSSSEASWFEPRRGNCC